MTEGVEFQPVHLLFGLAVLGVIHAAKLIAGTKPSSWRADLREKKLRLEEDVFEKINVTKGGRNHLQAVSVPLNAIEKADSSHVMNLYFFSTRFVAVFLVLFLLNPFVNLIYWLYKLCNSTSHGSIPREALVQLVLVAGVCGALQIGLYILLEKIRLNVADVTKKPQNDQHANAH